MTEVVISP